MPGFNWILPLIPLPAPPRAQGSGPGPGEAATSAGSGIKEDIDPKLRERYDKWKKELLSTAAGRATWDRFNNDPNFSLTIKMSRQDEKDIKDSDERFKSEHGGKASDGYRWDESGKLVGATIVLGSKLHQDYPSGDNYPILSSLRPPSDQHYDTVKGEVLAAAKMAHELGHVERAASLTPAEGKEYHRQNDLLQKIEAQYYKTHDMNDAELVRLRAELGRDSVGIGTEREHWAEANTIPFLREKLGDKLPDRTEDAIKDYQKRYPGR
jgi:hypothetical protein